MLLFETKVLFLVVSSQGRRGLPRVGMLFYTIKVVITSRTGIDGSACYILKVVLRVRNVD